MKISIRKFAETIGAKILTEPGFSNHAPEIEGVYVCDLLSRVLSKAKPNDAWVTVHTHLNVVAVAVMAGICCIVVPEEIEVEKPTIKKASEEGIAILSTKLTAYEICAAIARSVSDRQQSK